MSDQLPAPADTIGDFAARAADKLLRDMLPPERAAVAVRAIGGAVSVIARSMPSVADVMATQDGRRSLAMAVAMVALTGFSPGLPGMPGAKAYLIPRKVGRDKVQVVSWQISAAGLRHMAAEDGYVVTGISVFAGDMVECPALEDPTRTGWEPAPGPPAGDAAQPWAPLPIDQSSASPPRLRPVQPARCFDLLAGFLVLARARDTGAIHGWRWVDRETILVRRESSDAYGFAVRDMNDPKKADWQREKAADTPWVKWPLEMAEKAALAYAIRRGLVPLADRMTAVLSADVQPVIVDTTAEQVRQRPRIMVPESAPPALPAPALDFDSAEPTEAQKAAIRAAEAREAGEGRGK